jgi:hypothetical protein
VATDQDSYQQIQLLAKVPQPNGNVVEFHEVAPGMILVSEIGQIGVKPSLTDAQLDMDAHSLMEAIKPAWSGDVLSSATYRTWWTWTTAGSWTVKQGYYRYWSLLDTWFDFDVQAAVLGVGGYHHSGNGWSLWARQADGCNSAIEAAKPARCVARRRARPGPRR